MPSSQTRSWALWTVAALLLIALAWFFHRRINFNWASLGHQLHSISIACVAVGVAILYAGYWMRALRWAVLLSPVRRVSSWELLAPQLIGFTAVTLIGRLADLSRPYLIARRLRLPIASQLAVYSVERAFDLGAAAVLFSLTLAVAPRGIAHHAIYVHAGELSLAATVAIVLFAAALRFAGETLAALVRRMLHPLSPDLARRIAARVLDFREGLNTVATLREFFSAAAISLIMWTSIAVGYMLCARAFVAEPTLAHFSFTATMLILAASLGGSLFQLPIIGWFTQIAINATALHELFAVPVEAATAAAAVMLFVMNLDIIPLGLIAARIQGVSLRQAANQSATHEAEPLA